MKNFFLAFICFLCVSPIWAQVNLQNTLSERRHQIVCADYSPDGRHLVTGGLDSKVLLWDVHSGTKIKELSGLRRFPLSVQFSPNGKYVVAGGKDRRVSVWDVSSEKMLWSERGHRNDVAAVAVSPDNSQIASAGHDRQIVIWELHTGKEIRNLTGHTAEVTSVAYHPDGSRLISGSADGTVRVWNTSTGQMIKSFAAHQGWVRTVAYSPNGNTIASGGHDNTINIWNARNFELQNSILAHSGWVETLSFSPDGRYLVSGGHDNFLIMIEVNSGRIVFNSERQSYYVLSVAFNPNGKEFVSATLYSDQLMVWNTEALQIRPELPESLTDIRRLRTPEIHWNTPDHTQTENLSFRVQFSIQSEYAPESVILYLNDHTYSTLQEAQLAEISLKNIEQVVYLNEGANKLKLEYYYPGGMVESDILRLHYSPPAEDLVAEIIPEETVQPVEEIIPEQIQEEHPATIIEKEQKESVAKEETQTKEPIVQENDKIALVEEPLPPAPPATLQSELLDIPFENPANPYRFALIIGNEDYSSYQVGLQTESNVDYAIRDAKAFREYAVRVLGVPRDNILFLTNARAIEMDNEIQKLKNIIKALDGKADIMVYFAGHGFPDERTREPYIMPVDVTGTNLRFAISINEFYRELTQYPSQRITVFLDACFSGGARNVGLVSARGVRVRPQEHLLKGNLVVFSASSGNQSAHPYRDKQHGIFTYFLLEKLRQTQGNITYQELSNYLRETVGVRSAMINNTEQTPQTNVSVDVENIWSQWRIKP